MKRMQKSQLFFLELMVCLLFFSVCSAICLGVFASAHQRSAESDDLTQALLLAESAAETWKAAEGDLDTAEAWLSSGYYDEQWQPTGQENAAYALTITEKDAICPAATVCVTDLSSGQALCSLDVAVHRGKEAP